MLDNRSLTERYIGLFLFGFFLFCYPVLTIFNLPYLLFGIPLLFFYILIVFIIFCGKIPDRVHSSEPDTAGKHLKQSG